jgi:hypothetical protein
MSDQVISPPVSKARRTTFIALTVLLGLGLGIAGFGFLSLIGGWFGAGGREAHKVHDLGYGAVAGILIALPFLLQAWGPERKPAVMRGAAAAGLGFALGYAFGGQPGFALAPIVVVGLLWGFHPARGELTSNGRIQPIMAGLAVLAAVPLVMYALDQAELQRACAGDQHCEEFHYAGMAALALALPLAGLVASLRAPGWRTTAWLVTGASVVFGLSAILFPDAASSIGTTWGAVALGGGVVLVAIAEREARRPRSRSR